MDYKLQHEIGNMYENLETYSDSFNKKTYDTLFVEEYNKYKSMFDQIIAESEKAEDLDAFIEEVAGIIPGRLHKELEALPNKRKKEHFLMAHNLGMVSFVIPMFKHRRNDVIEAISERMIEKWNDHDINMKISGTTYESLREGFKTRWCYITTAVCESLGKPDDCYELNLLRNYRDEYLVKTKTGEALVKEYYDIAPTIVKKINRQENSKEVYAGIWNQYLKECVSLIEEEKKEECRETYTDMVHSLQEKYLYS